VDTPDLLIRKFCEAMEAKKDVIPWNFGPLKQPNMPLEKMVVESAATPIDLPFHRAAQEFWITPIETVSESEDGFERIYQGSQIIAVWPVELSQDSEWKCRLSLKIESPLQSVPSPVKNSAAIATPQVAD